MSRQRRKHLCYTLPNHYRMLIWKDSRKNQQKESKGRGKIWLGMHHLHLRFYTRVNLVYPSLKQEQTDIGLLHFVLELGLLFVWLIQHYRFSQKPSLSGLPKYHFPVWFLVIVWPILLFWSINPCDFGLDWNKDTLQVSVCTGCLTLVYNIRWSQMSDSRQHQQKPAPTDEPVLPIKEGAGVEFPI